MSKDVQENKVHATSRDVFLHVLGMTTLYASAISIVVIFFQIINLAIPDVQLGYMSYGESSKNILRTAVSFLVVMFPVSFYSHVLLHRTYQNEPAKLQLGIRRGLIYLTLFVVSFIIMFTLVFLLRWYMGGELTLRFFLKFIATLAVAGTVFGYYNYDLRRGSEVKKKSRT